MRDMQLVLSRWGAWAADDNSGVDWSPIAAGFKGLITNSKKARPSCCDDDGLFIDAAITKMREKRLQEEYALVVLHYICNVSKSAIARTWGCSEKNIRIKLMIAESFIHGCLEMAGVSLEMDPYTQRLENDSLQQS